MFRNRKLLFNIAFRFNQYFLLDFWWLWISILLLTKKKPLFIGVFKLIIMIYSFSIYNDKKVTSTWRLGAFFQSFMICHSNLDDSFLFFSVMFFFRLIFDFFFFIKSYIYLSQKKRDKTNIYPPIRLLSFWSLWNKFIFFLLQEKCHYDADEIYVFSYVMFFYFCSYSSRTKRRWKKCTWVFIDVIYQFLLLVSWCWRKKTNDSNATVEPKWHCLFFYAKLSFRIRNQRWKSCVDYSIRIINENIYPNLNTYVRIFYSIYKKKENIVSGASSGDCIV